MENIFIGIAAYNEPDLIQTIDSCISMAKHPERLCFGISAHYNDNNVPDLSKYKNIKVLNLEYDAQLGCSPGRLNTLSLYDFEKYFLQIDAHMLFEENWDEDLINSYNIIKKEFDKVIISSYVPWWYRDDNGNIMSYSKNSGHTMSVLKANNDLELNKSQKHLMLDAYSYDYLDKPYKEHYFLSGHFIFSEADFFFEVMPDPLIMFGGEEVVLPLRAWTRGYRMFSINKAIVWHRNKFEGDRYRYDWRFDQRDKNEKQMHYYRKEHRSLLHVRNICIGKELGYWGAKDSESLREYESLAGIDFKDLYKNIGDI